MDPDRRERTIFWIGMCLGFIVSMALLPYANALGIPRGARIPMTLILNVGVQVGVQGWYRGWFR